MGNLERFDRHADAAAEGCAWRTVTSAEALKLATGNGASGKDIIGHHKYDKAVWPSTLKTEATKAAAKLGVAVDSVELIAEITVLGSDPVTRVASVPGFVVRAGSNDEIRYQRIVGGVGQMKSVLQHLRRADEASRATTARFFFRLRDAA